MKFHKQHNRIIYIITDLGYACTLFLQSILTPLQLGQHLFHLCKVWAKNRRQISSMIMCLNN